MSEITPTKEQLDAVFIWARHAAAVLGDTTMIPLIDAAQPLASQAIDMRPRQQKDELDVARKLKETLFAIVNHSSGHRSDAYYGGVLVDSPEGPRVAYLKLTFEAPLIPSRSALPTGGE